VLPTTSKTQRTIAAVLAALVFLGASTTTDQKRLSIYSSVANYTLLVTDRQGREYVGLLEVLEPLGRITARIEGQHWKMRFNNTDADFVSGKTRAKVRGRDLDLSSAFLIENSRGLVPLSSLSTLLQRFLGNPVNFHESARRLFIGDIATQVTAQLDSSTPPRLVLNFTAPVNPTISTEPGKLKMVFGREPLIPPASNPLAFESTTISQANFSESNGTAELTIAATAPLMASFSNNGRTITVAATRQASAPSAGTPPVAGELPASESPPAPPTAPAPASSETPPESAPVRRPLAIVDPAHGGTERGAALSEVLAEKNVTLGFGRLLRHELERQGFAVMLLREGDDSLTLDQRAGAANAARALIYIGLHATSEGNGVRVYTALLPREGPDRGPFHAWNAAQTHSLPLSQSIAVAIVSELQKREFSARGLAASLRPLNNLVVPAVAVELAPGPNGVSDLPSANYQQKAAAAIADAVALQRPSLEVHP
jgi:N-acetylmuramoyl-L-alanine amidase